MQASNLGQCGGLLPTKHNKKSLAGNRLHKEMLKMKVAPGMYMKTKEATTICQA
jgi:hypothetical protein